MFVEERRHPTGRLLLRSVAMESIDDRGQQNLANSLSNYDRHNVGRRIRGGIRERGHWHTGWYGSGGSCWTGHQPTAPPALVEVHCPLPTPSRTFAQGPTLAKS